MKKLEIESKLHGMIGKLYLHKQKEHRIIRYEVKSTFTKVTTSKEDLILGNDLIDEFFNGLLFIDEDKPFIPKVPAVQNKTEAMPVQENTQISLTKSTIQDNLGKLSDIIQNNIELINADPKNIPQANAINEQLKSLIELGKTEVEIIKCQIQMHRINLKQNESF